MKSTRQHRRQKNQADHQLLVQAKRANYVQLRIKIHRAFWMQAARTKSEPELDLIVISWTPNRDSDDSVNYSIGHFASINSEFPTERCFNSTRVSREPSVLWEAFNKAKCYQFLFQVLLSSLKYIFEVQESFELWLKWEM